MKILDECMDYKGMDWWVAWRWYFLNKLENDKDGSYQYDRKENTMVSYNYDMWMIRYSVIVSYLTGCFCWCRCGPPPNPPAIRHVKSLCMHKAVREVTFFTLITALYLSSHAHQASISFSCLSDVMSVSVSVSVCVSVSVNSSTLDNGAFLPFAWDAIYKKRRTR